MRHPPRQASPRRFRPASSKVAFQVLPGAISAGRSETAPAVDLAGAVSFYGACWYFPRSFEVSH
jgi:hypothetical protein